MTNTPSNKPKTQRGRSVARAVRRRSEQGLHPTSFPLGYRPGPGPVSVPDPETAPLMREAIELTATGGYSLRGLLEVMLAKGFRSKGGKVPSAASFRAMVTNPFYAGHVVLAGQVFPGRHEPLVSERTLELAVKALSSRRKR